MDRLISALVAAVVAALVSFFVSQGLDRATAVEQAEEIVSTWELCQRRIEVAGISTTIYELLPACVEPWSKVK